MKTRLIVTALCIAAYWCGYMAGVARAARAYEPYIENAYLATQIAETCVEAVADFVGGVQDE